MEKSGKTILVTGATGRQGGAAVRNLLASGWKVRALTRNPSPSNPTVKWLAEIGARVEKGDLGDRASLEPVLEGCYGVFSMQNFWEHGYEEEVQQGKNLAHAAKAAGVKHFLYSSVGGADRNTGIPHFESKWEIECYIRELGLPSTILRPVFFMENFSSRDLRLAILGGRLTLALRPDKPLQMISVEDIGAIAALCFERPQEYMGKAIEIAGDEMTMSQVVECFSRAMGRPVRFEEMPIEKLQSFSKEMAVMFKWFNEKGYQADIPLLRAMHPRLMTLETWLHETGWHKAELGAA